MTLNSVREEASTYDQLAAHWQAGAACAITSQAGGCVEVNDVRDLCGAGPHSSGFSDFLAMIFWAAMLKSGAHATIAGVILGTITAAQSLGRKSTFIEAVQHTLQHVRDSLD